MENEPFAVVLNTKITAISFQKVMDSIFKWIKTNDKRKYVCICNTQSLVTASNDSRFQNVLKNADICTPDGMPLVWAMRMFGFKNQERVDGPNLMLKLCEHSVKHNTRIFLYGGKNETLIRLNEKLVNDYRGIKIVGTYSPPFRHLDEKEVKEIQCRINETHPDLVFVSLGCPKQEFWMNENYQSINGVLIGVGAAFNYIIGDIKRPPMIFQKMGLEWLFRLFTEPKRLFKRYMYNNSAYIYKFIKTFARSKKENRKKCE